MESSTAVKSNTVIVTSEEALASILNNMLPSLIRKEMREKDKETLFEKFLSPAETCELFVPKISKVTLSAWTKAGRIQEHRIGGRVYYKYSEVINSLQTLKKYKKN